MSLLTQPQTRAAPQTGGFTGATTVLAPGKLYALQHPFALDGRVSSYPASARGFSVANSYVLAQTDAAMLIATRWLYDRATRTLFSSDMFTHVWRTDADGPWIVTEEDDTASARALRSFLLNTRYWWLEGAPTASIRRGILDVFDKCDVETI